MVAGGRSEAAERTTTGERAGGLHPGGMPDQSLGYTRCHPFLRDVSVEMTLASSECIHF